MSVMAKSRGNTQTVDLSDPKDRKIEQLKKKVERLETQKANYRAKYLKAKTAKEELMLKYKALERKKQVTGSAVVPPVRKVCSQFPELNSKLREFCKEWEVPTRNWRNTCNAILTLLEPDVNGVPPKYSEKDVVRFLTVLMKLDKTPKEARRRYLQHPALATYYPLRDSYDLFKHYDKIRAILLEWLNPSAAEVEKVGGKLRYATLNGVQIEPKVQTMVCSWEDFLQQRRGVSHPNDSSDISLFKGDDLIRERERRAIAKMGGTPNRSVVEEIIQYQAKKVAKPAKDEYEDIINQTEIKEVRY